jgi:hypothetical protein
MYYILQHPQTDKIAWTDDRDKVHEALQQGWLLVCSSPFAIGELP